MKLLTREALLSFRRAPLLSALSITTIAFSLFTLGLFGLVAINLREALRGLEERVEIVAFVLRGTPAETIALATEDIAAFPEVQDVQYISEGQALERARRELVEFRDAYRDLQVNPLPASIEVRLKDGNRDAATVERVAQRLRGFSFINDVRFGREWVQKLDHLRNVTGIVGLVIGLAFAAVAVVIIGVTIRLTLLQRAREISIMRLVGATNWFIRGPFLLEGALKGLLGGLLSLVLCYGGYLLFRDRTGGAFAGLIFFQTVPDGGHRGVRRDAGAGGEPGERGATPAACVGSGRSGRREARERAMRRPLRRLRSSLPLLLFCRPRLLASVLHAQDTDLERSRQRPEEIRRERDRLQEQQQRLQGQVHDVNDELSNLERQRESTQRIVDEIERQIGGLRASSTARARS